MNKAVRSEAAMLIDIEKDLVAARRECRFEESLCHLDEIFAIYLHTGSQQLRLRCAALMAAPEPIQQAA
jgi:hypothetical protein